MIEKTVIAFLSGLALAAFAEEPQEHSCPYYVVQKTGGGGSAQLRRAMVAVQSYGETMLQAADANETVIAAILGMTALDGVASVSLNSDYNFTDTAAKKYRYQAVFDITYYEEA